MSKARYIVMEGLEGVGKTTQTQNLVDYLREQGYKVLQTKEPGTPLVPVTLQLRKLMLDNQYDEALTPAAREFISQAIRSIHMERLIYPSMDQYDFIVQDRGIISGLAYGSACGHSREFLEQLAQYVTTCGGKVDKVGIYKLYDDVVFMTGNVAENLAKAKAAKQEFETGDAMESRGLSFLEQCRLNMEQLCTEFGAKTVNVDGKNIEEVFGQILAALDLKR